MLIEFFAIASGGLGLVALVWMVVSHTQVQNRVRVTARNKHCSEPR